MQGDNFVVYSNCWPFVAFFDICGAVLVEDPTPLQPTRCPGVAAITWVQYRNFKVIFYFFYTEAKLRIILQYCSKNKWNRSFGGLVLTIEEGWREKLRQRSSSLFGEGGGGGKIFTIFCRTSWFASVNLEEKVEII